jgi:hypothetical protein
MAVEVARYYAVNLLLWLYGSELAQFGVGYLQLLKISGKSSTVFCVMYMAHILICLGTDYNGRLMTSLYDQCLI